MNEDTRETAHDTRPGDNDQDVAQKAAPEAVAGGKKRFRAFICMICPFCIAARLFPKSKYAEFMKKAEADCPACKAYAELKGN